MRDLSAAGLCGQGILDGAVCLKEDKMIHKTNKESAAPKYRKVKIKDSGIDRADSGKGFFPTVTVSKKNGNAYRFIVFNRKKFLNRYKELK